MKRYKLYFITFFIDSISDDTAWKNPSKYKITLAEALIITS